MQLLGLPGWKLALGCGYLWATKGLQARRASLEQGRLLAKKDGLGILATN